MQHQQQQQPITKQQSATQQPPQILQQQQRLLSHANPIIKRQKLKPLSIFPMLQLPTFTYPKQNQQPQQLVQLSEIINNNNDYNLITNNKKTATNKLNINTNSNNTDSYNNGKQKLILQSNKLTQLFKNTIYTYNDRLQCNNNNDFGCIRVKYSQSKLHPIIKQQLKQQYLQKQVKNNYEEDVLAEQQYNMKQMQGKQIKLIKQNKQINIDENYLQFQSKFQSGNLAFVAKQSSQNSNNNNTYNLLLTRDMNTSKCTQWFFFRVKSNKSGKYRFNILNFLKKYSIFQNGMKICYASSHDNYCWRRGCESIKYQCTNIPSTNKSKNYYYSLSFSYTFQKNEEETVYFAYCYPYTYSMLENFLFKVGQNLKYKSYFKRRNIALSLGGNYVDLVTITNFKKKQNKKRVIFISARVHPSETPSSFVCQGMMKYLLSNTAQAEALRDKFIFKIIPMLNPDGVINGAYRCNLIGYDLNRVWNIADRISHPEVYGAKKAILETSEKNNIFLFADLHAHSQKKGVFMYGTQNRNNPYLCRQIPFLLWKAVPQFNYYQCNFGMKKGREGTSRLCINRQLDLAYSYTMQHSYCGPSKQRIHFSINDYLKIGQSFFATIHKFYCNNRNTINKNIQDNSAIDSFLKQLYTNKQMVKIGDSDALSSSDQELQEEKKNLFEMPEEKSYINQKQTSRHSETTMKNYKPPLVKNLKKIVSNQEKKSFFENEQKGQFYTKYSNRSIQNIKQLAVVYPSFLQQKKKLLLQSRFCYSSLTTPYNQPPSPKKQPPLTYRGSLRYEEQQEQVNSLSNLFLPVLKNSSYKKYSRKTITKKLVHIGKNPIDSVIFNKQQIKAVEKKKPIGWREKAQSFL